MLFHHNYLSTPSINDIDRLCQYYLTILYHESEIKGISTTHDVCQIYGEILYPGVDKILAVIQPSESDVFVDYGSGLGKMVLQVFLKSLVKAAYGIEIVPELYQHACNATQRLQQDLPGFYQQGRTLSFLSGDFLQVRIATATIAMVTSTCFSQSLLNQLGTIFEQTPSIHTVLSLRPFKTLERLAFRRTIRIESSWDTVLCYVYCNS